MSHPKSKDLRAILTAARRKKEYRGALSAFPVFVQRLKSFFSGTGRLGANAAPLLQQIKSLAGEGSLMGRMASEFLELQ